MPGLSSFLFNNSDHDSPVKGPKDSPSAITEQTEPTTPDKERHHRHNHDEHHHSDKKKKSSKKKKDGPDAPPSPSKKKKKADPGAPSSPGKKKKEDHAAPSSPHKTKKDKTPTPTNSPKKQDKQKKKKEQPSTSPSPKAKSSKPEEPPSIHKLVNKERHRRKLPLLGRSRAMDRLAQRTVDKMAKHDNPIKGLELVSAQKLAKTLNTSVVSRNVEVCNVVCIKELHKLTMEKGSTSREKILNPRYEACGMATAISKKTANIYLVQIFRGKIKRAAVVWEKWQSD